MRLRIAIAFALAVFAASFAAAGTTPFTIEIGAPLNIRRAPALQSMAAAQSGGRWLFIGGRTAGLHTFKRPSAANPANNFPPSQNNDRAWVVDPVKKRVWSAKLPAGTGPFLVATNAQSEQDGDTLYIAGGYGLWPGGAPGPNGADNMRTFDTLTAIDVPRTIDAIVNGKPFDAFITQIHDGRMRVTGGELRKAGEWFYLVFGQVFDGLYSPDDAQNRTMFVQSYTEQIAVFQIQTSPLKIVDFSTIKATQITPPAVSTDPAPDARPFHRRDLTVGPIITPQGAAAIVAWGGVFPPGQITTYRKPVYITGPAAADVRIDGYRQLMSQYNCAIVPMYSEASRTMYTTFLGGISLHYLFGATQTLKRDGGIPFIDEVTTLSVARDGTSSECVATFSLPALLGAGAAFLASPNVTRFDNGVIKLDSITERTLVGYMYGGIRSSAPQTTQGEPTFASATAYPIFITPRPSTCIDAAEPGDE